MGAASLFEDVVDRLGESVALLSAKATKARRMATLQQVDTFVQLLKRLEPYPLALERELLLQKLKRELSTLRRNHSAEQPIDDVLCEAISAGTLPKLKHADLALEQFKLFQRQPLRPNRTERRQ